jgi:hypothetical protein
MQEDSQEKEQNNKSEYPNREMDIQPKEVRGLPDNIHPDDVMQDEKQPQNDNFIQRLVHSIRRRSDDSQSVQDEQDQGDQTPSLITQRLRQINQESEIDTSEIRKGETISSTTNKDKLGTSLPIAQVEKETPGILRPTDSNTPITSINKEQSTLSQDSPLTSSGLAEQTILSETSAPTNADRVSIDPSEDSGPHITKNIEYPSIRTQNSGFDEIDEEANTGFFHRQADKLLGRTENQDDHDDQEQSDDAISQRLQQFSSTSNEQTSQEATPEQDITNSSYKDDDRPTNSDTDKPELRDFSITDRLSFIAEETRPKPRVGESQDVLPDSETPSQKNETLEQNIQREDNIEIPEWLRDLSPQEPQKKISKSKDLFSEVEIELPEETPVTSPDKNRANQPQETDQMSPDLTFPEETGNILNPEWLTEVDDKQSGGDPVIGSLTDDSLSKEDFQPDSIDGNREQFDIPAWLSLTGEDSTNEKIVEETALGIDVTSPSNKITNGDDNKQVAIPEWISRMAKDISGEENSENNLSEAEELLSAEDKIFEDSEHIQIPDWITDIPPVIAEEEIPEPKSHEDIHPEDPEQIRIPDWIRRMSVDLPEEGMGAENGKDELLSSTSVETSDSEPASNEIPEWVSGTPDQRSENDILLEPNESGSEKMIESPGDIDEHKIPQWASDLPPSDEDDTPRSYDVSTPLEDETPWKSVIPENDSNMSDKNSESSDDGISKTDKSSPAISIDEPENIIDEFDSISSKTEFPDTGNAIHSDDEQYELIQKVRKELLESLPQTPSREAERQSQHDEEEPQVSLKERFSPAFHWITERKIWAYLFLVSILFLFIGFLLGKISENAAITPDDSGIKTESMLPAPYFDTAIHPIGIKFPGGWYFYLSTGQVADGQWTPSSSAEYLLGSEVRRIIAVPWNQQIDAVIQTLETKAEFRLTMSNNDILTYSMAHIERVPRTQIDIFSGTDPSLVVIIVEPDSDMRWVITCLP